MTVTILIILDPDYPCYHMSIWSLSKISAILQNVWIVILKKISGESRTIRELDLKPANLQLYLQHSVWHPIDE